MLEKRILHDVHTTLKKGEEMGVNLLNISEKSVRFNQWDAKSINEFIEDFINHTNASIVMKKARQPACFFSCCY
jgi:hypothetical protein